MLTADVVASFFQGISRLYVKDAVEVELLTRARSCPVQGMVGWDVDRWRIIADRAMTPKALLVLLFHELGHIHFGDATRTQNSWSWDRAVFTGQQTVAAALRRQGWVVQGQEPETKPSEDRVNEWAVRQVRTWLPVLDAIRNAQETAKRTVERTMS